MKTLLWAVAVLAIEVWLLWGYFAVTGMGRMASTTVALALLVGNASVMVWLGFVSGFEQTWRRLLLTVIGCIVVTYAALVVASVLMQPQYPQATGIFPQVVSCVKQNPDHPTSDRNWQPTLIVTVEPGRDPGRVREYRVLGCRLYYYYHRYFR